MLTMEPRTFTGFNYLLCIYTGLSLVDIVGIVIGSVILIAIFCCCCCCVYALNEAKNSQPNAGNEEFTTHYV